MPHKRHFRPRSDPSASNFRVFGPLRSLVDTPTPAQTLVASPLALTSEDFVARFAGTIRHAGQGGRSGALAAYRAVFREGKLDIPGAAATVPPIVRTLREQSPEGEVVKFLSRLETRAANHVHAEPTFAFGPAPSGAATRDPNAPGTGHGRDVSHRFETLDIESVLIPMIGSSGQTTYTLCVSSQVGCAMGCTFCETGQMGLIRSLTAAEIVSQWWNAAHRIGIRPKNIVFMGMGEPMDNLDEVLKAIAVLKDHNGPHVAISQICISTVGRVDGIEKLSRHVRTPGWHRLGLALSLNAPNDADRSKIMPINRRWNLADLQKALLAWPQTSGNKVCVEYVLIPGVNDTQEHARQIAEFMTPFGLLSNGRINGTRVMAILNLIPYNPRRESPWPAPTEEKVAEFLGWLMELGVFAKRRRTKGRDMMGACGQLGTENIRQRKPVQPTIGASDAARM